MCQTVASSPANSEYPATLTGPGRKSGWSMGGNPNGPSYRINYRVVTPTSVELDLGLLDWADWDHRGHLVFARRGCLFRRRFQGSYLLEELQLADFNPLKFEELPPTPQACHWPKAVRRKDHGD